MKKIYFLLLLAAHASHAQRNIYRELEQKLANEKTDERKLELISELSDTAYMHSLDQALGYVAQGIVLSEKINDKKWEPRFYAMKGKIQSFMLRFDSAKFYLKKAIAGYSSTADKKGEATASFQLAWVLKRSGQKAKAMEYDLSALRLMEETGDQAGIATAYDRISDGLTRQERKTEALDYGNRAIELAKKNNFAKELAYAYFNMGNVYIAMNRNKESWENYNNAIVQGNSLGFDPVSIITFTVGRGNALKRQKRYDEALKDYNYAYENAIKVNYVNAISVAIANLGEINILRGNYKEALPYQLETVRLQERDSNFTNLTENYMHVSTIYEKLGDYKEALVYQKKSRAMRDRTASFDSDTTMSRLLTQYQTEKKEATIAAQQKEISQQQKIQWLIAGALILLAAFVLFIYRSLRNRNRTNKLLAAKNEENELLLKEIHHRVKNNLEVVSSLLALQSAEIDDPGTKEAMQDGQSRVHSIGIVHQKLYQGENLGSIEMKDYLVNLSESILDSYGAEDRVNIELAMEKLNVDIDTAVPLGLIINELLTNTLKYAFPDNKKGSVLIKLEKKAGTVLHLEVSDNGIGKSGTTQGSGFGSQLISLLTRQLNGTMKEEVKNGTHIFFDFKLDKVA